MYVLRIIGSEVVKYVPVIDDDTTSDENVIPDNDDVIITPDGGDDSDVESDNDESDKNPETGVTANFSALIILVSAIVLFRKKIKNN